MSETVLITHNDFDGTVCAVLFKAFWPDGVLYLENYDTVDERIKQVLKEDPGLLCITDITPQSEEVVKALDDHRYVVFLFDHHKTALHLNSFGWARVRTESCAAGLFKKWLEAVTSPYILFDKLVFHANDYDLWLHQDPHSAVLNSLLYAIGHERFINRFLQNPSVELTEAEKYLLDIEKEKEEKYIQEAVEAAKVYGPFVITFAEKLISQVGQKLLETFPVDIAVIVNVQKGVVSLRSKETDVSALAKALGGGGHPRAAGFTFSRHSFWDSIINLMMGVPDVSSVIREGNKDG